MTKEKEQTLERIAEKFKELDADSKNFIAGYIAGKQEEKAKWEREKQTA